MAGRPTLFTKQLADEICERLADGETLSAMCRDNDHLPVRSTVSLWIATKEEFSDRVARAREAGSHVLVDETREIADDGSNDWMEKRYGETTAWVTNGEALGRSKLRIEQRWREAEAILPKVYGRKTQVEHSGSVNLTLSSDDELMAELVQLLTTGRLKLPGGLEVAEVDDPPAAEDEDEDCPW